MDGGQNWIQQESGVSGPLNSVDFINSNYGNVNKMTHTQVSHYKGRP